MYLPKAFESVENSALYQLIDQYSLGTLVTQDQDGLCANHIPFLLDVKDPSQAVLRGHVAKGNPIWKQQQGTSDALVIFQGQQGYISPSFYPSKKETGKVVPTFNYEVVHAYGQVQFFHEPERLLDIVNQLTTKHEKNQAAPWQVSDAPSDYIDKMLNAIVGIEIPIRRLIGKSKMSQNQPEENKAGVVDGLRALGSEAANAMADVIDKRRQ